MTKPSEAPAAAPDTEALPDFTQALQLWVDALRQAVGRYFGIAVLETRLAALSFALILIIGVASGLLFATAWIAAFAALAVWIHQLGLTWPLALLVVAAVNLLLGIGGCYAIYRMSNNLLFRTIREFILATEKPHETPPATADRPRESAQ